jgi:rfaE bifunctional protein nucleotidyltransferase chain/domain
VTQKIVEIEELKKRVAQWRIKSNTLVFTNGCFDILHVGHIHTLQEAKKLGDKLIVALNSDASVRILKGEERPINNEKDRASIIAALDVVDLVVIFREQTPIIPIELICPEILVKGGDWKVEEIVGGEFVQEHGGKVYAIPFQEGYSSSNLIEKIKKL